MKKSIITILVLCIFCCMFVGCNNKQGYTIVKFDRDYFGGEYLNIKAVVNSKEELDDICNQIHVKKEFESGVFEEYGIEMYVDECDEEYFKEKSLLICLFSIGHGANLSVDSIDIENDVVIINILEKELLFGFHTYLVEQWTCIIELDKNDVSSNAQLDINFKTKKVLF